MAEKKRTDEQMLYLALRAEVSVLREMLFESGGLDRARFAEEFRAALQRIGGESLVAWALKPPPPA